jgi:hypothetical protein
MPILNWLLNILLSDNRPEKYENHDQNHKVKTKLFKSKNNFRF